MKIFVTGSTTGLGELAALELLQMGHEVIFHARGPQSQMKKDLTYVLGDFSKQEEIKLVAHKANEYGPFDAIIHNAGVSDSDPETIFTVNVLAPYTLSCLMHRPKRMVYLSSSLHMNGHVDFDRLKASTYSDSKLYVTMLAKYFSRIWPDTFVNAVDPGWVPTRMGGSGATDDLKKGIETQTWLSTSFDNTALVSGQYFHHMRQKKTHADAESHDLQNKLIEYLNFLAH